MTDIKALKALAEAVRELEDQPEKSYEHEEAKDALWLHMHCHTVMDLIAEIDSLKSRLEMESAELAWSDSDGRAIQAERDHLKADNEALRKDAERYRWLMKKGLHTEIYANSSAVAPGRGPYICVDLPSCGAPNRVALGSGADGYIDAAMSKEPDNG